MEKMLEKLCGAYGVSGAEDNACEAALGLLKQYAPDAHADKFGCVTGFIGDRNNGKPTVMLEAHIDEIGFIVTYIDDDGFIRVGNCGGTDRCYLHAPASCGFRQLKDYENRRHGDRCRFHEPRRSRKVHSCRRPHHN